MRVAAKCPRIPGARGDLPFAMVPGAEGSVSDEGAGLSSFAGCQYGDLIARRRTHSGLGFQISSTGRAEAFGLPMHRRERGSGGFLRLGRLFPCFSPWGFSERGHPNKHHEKYRILKVRSLPSQKKKHRILTHPYFGLEFCWCVELQMLCLHMSGSSLMTEPENPLKCEKPSSDCSVKFGSQPTTVVDFTLYNSEV